MLNEKSFLRWFIGEMLTMEYFCQIKTSNFQKQI